MHLNWLAKFDSRWPGPLVVKINISLLYTYILFYAKMQKETEETLSLVVFIFIIGLISIGERASWPPSGYA